MKNDNIEPILFTDRQNEFNIINNAFTKLMADNSYFNVLSFYGIGGIGKSRLIKYAFQTSEILNHQNLIELKINLEIVKSDNVLNAIFGLRKQIPTTCPIFDYAIMNFWNKFSPYELNTEFSKSIFEQCFAFLSDKPDISYNNINILPIVGNLISGIKQLGLDSIFYSEIENLSYNEFLKKIPEYLGIDIRNKYFDKYLIIFIDAYEQYNTNWLETLISNINFGVFIITSREKLKWKKLSVNEYQLIELPNDDTRKLLCKYNINNYQIENILNISECIPIYIELAIHSIQGNEAVYYFNDKNDIIDKFFNHLEKNQQELLIVLSLVQIFNDEIFENIIKSLNLQISVLEFFDLKNLSIIQNIKDFDDFYKVHDVISNNIQKLYNYEYRKKVFDCYLETISKCNLNNLQKTMLYKHILSLFIQNNFSLDKNTCERILDLFFIAKGTLLPIEYESVKNYGSNSKLKPVYYFTKAIYNEREASLLRLEWLEKIKHCVYLLGKHKKSYNIIHDYLLGLLGDQSYLISTLNSIDKLLTAAESNEWYYGQTKVFLGDYNVTQGKFITAKCSLEDFKNQLENQNNIIDNYIFQVNRHIGHLYRFNLFCEDAFNQYKLALHSTGIPTEMQKLYIFTNYCETACLYNYEYVEANYMQFLKLCKKYKDLKSAAKIYCSVALVLIKNKKYKKAKKYLRKSIYLNILDGYKSGIMFSYLHQLYLEKKTKKHVSSNTRLYFEKQLESIGRYGYYKLPLAILDNDIEEIERIKRQYEWLDFDKTLNEYMRLFQDLNLVY